MDRANFGCGWSDLDGNIVFANKALCHLLGAPQDDVVGTNMKDYYPAEVRDQLVDIILPEVLEKGEWEGELEIVSIKGPVNYCIQKIFLVMEDDKPKYFANAITDITEHKKYEDLLHTDKLTSLGTLVAGVAHEINNANTFVKLGGPGIGKVWKSICPIVKKHCEENDIKKIGNLETSNMENYVGKLISGIEEGADRIQALVTELKNFARKEKPDFRKFVDVNDVVQAAVLLVGSKIKRATYNFSEDYAEDVPHIRGSRQQIEQVVVNLLVNSCEAMEDPKKNLMVATEFDEKNHRVLIKVTDEGGGIPPEILDHITDSFFTTKVETGGTGLGLAISSRIVSDHGGELLFDSQLNKGTIATMSLPVEKSNE
ncbi:hypothetical protein BVX94_03810 [bacterium B17]|nr:hypothetical protein BVX94_03810 [bacterium B17]